MRTLEQYFGWKWPTDGNLVSTGGYKINVRVGLQVGC